MRASLAFLVLLPACAAPVAERDLFRLAGAPVAASAVAPGDPIVAPDAPPTLPGRALRTDLRLVRGDGVRLAAPSIVTFDGQRARLQIVNEAAYIADFDVEIANGQFIGDPVIDVLRTGLTVDLVVRSAATPSDAAVAFRVVAADSRKPAVSKTVTVTDSPPRGVGIEFPRVENVAVAGARRVPVGVETELARIPDPSGRGAIRVLGTVGFLPVEGGADDGGETQDQASREAVLRASVAAVAASRGLSGIEGEAEAAGADLTTLAALAAAGRPERDLRVSAVRWNGPDTSTAGEALSTMTLRSVVGPGVGVSDRLGEACILAWSEVAAGAAADPQVGAVESGVGVACGHDGRFAVTWTTTPWDALRASEDAAGRSLTADVSRTVSASCIVAPGPGRTAVPLLRLRDGGLAGIVIDW